MKQVTKTTLIVVDFENYLDELVFRSVVEEGNEVLVYVAHDTVAWEAFIKNRKVRPCQLCIRNAQITHCNAPVRYLCVSNFTGMRTRTHK